VGGALAQADAVLISVRLSSGRSTVNCSKIETARATERTLGSALTPTSPFALTVKSLLAVGRSIRTPVGMDQRNAAWWSVPRSNQPSASTPETTGGPPHGGPPGKIEVQMERAAMLLSAPCGHGGVAPVSSLYPSLRCNGNTRKLSFGRPNRRCPTGSTRSRGWPGDPI